MGDIMIKIILNNQLLNSLIKIEQNKTILENTKVPVELHFYNYWRTRGVPYDTRVRSIKKSIKSRNF